MTTDDKVFKTDEQWKEELTPEQYRIMREKDTEAPFTGKYYATKDNGVYKCAACGNELFSSNDKFDSGSGWPSFTTPVTDDNVVMHADHAYGMERTEVVCNKCGAHLGHVFNDGPGPTCQRFCINSAALNLKKAEDTSDLK